MRNFNTAGPVRPNEHYCIPPLDRLNLREVLALIRRRRHFILHALRQTGKTSTLLALRDLLNGGSAGRYRCVHVNVEPGQGLEQTADHMDLSGTDNGHLVLFDVRGGRSWEERVFREEHAHDGKRITVWGA